MDDLLGILLLLAGPVGVFWIWHKTEDRKLARRRMALVIGAAALLGMIDAREEPANALLGSAILYASPGVFLPSRSPSWEEDASRYLKRWLV